MSAQFQVDLNRNTIDALLVLVQLNVESADGFRHVANQVEDEWASSAFSEIATQRKDQAKELSSFVTWNADVPTRRGSYVAEYHQSWISCHKLLPSTDLKAVVEEIKRGEEILGHAYASALQMPVRQDLLSVLASQNARTHVVSERLNLLRANAS